MKKLFFFIILVLTFISTTQAQWDRSRRGNSRIATHDSLHLVTLDVDTIYSATNTVVIKSNITALSNFTLSLTATADSLSLRQLTVSDSGYIDTLTSRKIAIHGTKATGNLIEATNNYTDDVTGDSSFTVDSRGRVWSYQSYHVGAASRRAISAPYEGNRVRICDDGDISNIDISNSAIGEWCTYDGDNYKIGFYTLYPAVNSFTLGEKSQQMDLVVTREATPAGTDSSIHAWVDDGNGKIDLKATDADSAIMTVDADSARLKSNNPWAVQGNVTMWNALTVRGQITSSLAVGTSPFAVTSTTVNSNLNADLLDGEEATAFQDAHASLTSISGLTEADVSILETTADNTYNVVTSGGNNYILGSNSGNSALEFKAPTGSGSPVLATSPSLVTPDIGAATGTSLAVTGNLTGCTSVTLDTDASVVLTAADCKRAARINNDADAIDYTLPAAAAGLVVVFYDIAGGVITIDPVDGTDTIYLDGASVGAGDAIDSPGAAGDYIALMAIDDTRWITVGRSGTWVDGGAD